MCGAKEVALAGNAAYAGRALRVHFMPDACAGHGDETKTVLRRRSRQCEQIVGPVEAKRGQVVQLRYSGNELRLQVVGELFGSIGRSTLVIPAADEKITATGAELGGVVGGHS